MSDACCHASDSRRYDWLLIITGTTCLVAYLLFLLSPSLLQSYASITILCQAIFELLNTMWFGVILGILSIALLHTMPRSLIMALLGPGRSLSGMIRATLAGILFDLCSHGILMVGIKLYERGASFGQLIAFLVASPWNSLSLTFILFALIGPTWTIAFIALSLIIAIIAGLIVEWCIPRHLVPTIEHHTTEPSLSIREAWQSYRSTWHFSWSAVYALLWEGVKGARIIIRWLLVGVILTALIRAFIPADLFQTYAGPTLLGLGVTLMAATIIEVCSEGATPLAAEILNHAKAPGNSFAFLMTGVATDYTEIMTLKDATKRWSGALLLPLVTVPQVVLIGWILNQL